MSVLTITSLCPSNPSAGCSPFVKCCQFKGRLSVTDLCGRVARGAGELVPAGCVSVGNSDSYSALLIVTGPFSGLVNRCVYQQMLMHSRIYLKPEVR